MPLDALYRPRPGCSPSRRPRRHREQPRERQHRRLQAPAGGVRRTCSTPSSRRSRRRRRAADGPRRRDLRRSRPSSSRAPCRRPASRSIWRSRATGFFEVSKRGRHEGLHPRRQLRHRRAGQLVTPTGERPQSADRDPAEREATSRSTPTATVTVKVTGTLKTLGQLGIATFPNPAGLSSLGDNQYGVDGRLRRPDARRRPGSRASARFAQGVLEMSNVNAVDEMVGMITTQRAYEAVSKVVTRLRRDAQAANELRR